MCGGCILFAVRREADIFYLYLLINYRGRVWPYKLPLMPTIQLPQLQQLVLDQLTPLLTGASLAELDAISTFSINTADRFAARQEVLDTDGDLQFVTDSLQDEVPIMTSQLDAIAIIGQKLAEAARVMFIENLAGTIVNVLAGLITKP